MSELTAADDGFHPPASDDPLWTETTWWGFLVPDHSLGGMIYTLFRPNLGVASLVVQVWDDQAVEPWLAPYARTLWHVPHPSDDLTDCRVAGLELRCVAPLSTYELRYDDGDALSFELTYTALAAPVATGLGTGNGHFDQACQVRGELRLGGHDVVVDAPAVRDRSWYVRQDLRSLQAGYTYGVVDRDEHFLAHSFPTGDAGDSPTDETTIVGGYLTRGGTTSALASGTRRVVARRRGHPDIIEVEAVTEEGATLQARSTTYASLASQSTPGMFAWMSVVHWDVDGRAGVGEDHDVWSPDRLAATRGPRLSTR